MTDDNSDRKTLSRRKVLGAVGASGVAVGVAGLGTTMAQFTDEENVDPVTFTAGGVDLRVRAGASYNGEALQSFDASEFSPQEEGIALSLDDAFDDIKPGDHGCFAFGIEVQNNPAWVASCIGYENNIDGEVFEPEVEADDDLSDNQIDLRANAAGQGEIPENMMVIPFYGGTVHEGNQWDPCQFYDENDENYDKDNYQGSQAIGTTTDFWSNSEDGLTPTTLYDATRLQAIDTQAWDANGVTETYDVSDSIVVDDGCVFLNGALGDDNQQEAAPVQPGNEFRFGWDWHVPFDTGNEMQGDELTLNLGFTAGQVRHTDSAELSNVFDPQENTPTPSS